MNADWSEEVNPQQRKLALQSIKTWGLRAKADKVYRIVDSYLDLIGEGEIESIWLIGSRAGQHSDTKNHGGVPNENSDWDWLVVGDGFDEIEEELVRQYEDGENPNHPIFKKFEGHDLSTRGNANDITLSSTEPVGFGIKIWPEESSESEAPASRVSEAVGRMLANGKPSRSIIAEVDWNLFSDTMRILSESCRDADHVNGSLRLLELFGSRGKLTGRLEEDARYAAQLYALMEEDEDFDVFAHLKGTGKVDPEDCVLTVSEPNSKLGQINAPSLALPAGYTCPFADTCKSFVHREGKPVFTNPDGKKSIIKDLGTMRCFSASSEAAYPTVRRLRWRNYDLIDSMYKDGGVDAVAGLIVRSIAHYENTHPRVRLFRIHDSGDFFKQWYFDAWIKTAKLLPQVLFYAYTKSIPFWAERKNSIPTNLRLIASEGGTEDAMITKEGFRKAIVVKDTGEAVRKRLHVDVNDFLAAFGDDDFALLMHGVQSAASGNTKLAMDNSKIIKKAAERFNVTPTEIEALIRRYTSS